MLHLTVPTAVLRNIWHLHSLLEESGCVQQTFIEEQQLSMFSRRRLIWWQTTGSTDRHVNATKSHLHFLSSCSRCCFVFNFFVLLLLLGFYFFHKKQNYFRLQTQTKSFCIFTCGFQINRKLNFAKMIVTTLLHSHELFYFLNIRKSSNCFFKGLISMTSNNKVIEWDNFRQWKGNSHNRVMMKSRQLR